MNTPHQEQSNKHYTNLGKMLITQQKKTRTNLPDVWFLRVKHKDGTEEVIELGNKQGSFHVGEIITIEKLK